MKRAFGVLAEDATDKDTIKVFVDRIAASLKKQRQYGFKGRCGKGCAKLRRKAEPWMRDLAAEGVTHFVIVHDLDRDPENNALNDESSLRSRIEGFAFPKATSRHVCIPVEELEAWFWSDPKLISNLTKGKKKAAANPTLISSPKDALIRACLDAQRRPRYSQLDNPKLAEDLDFDICRKRCPAFAAFQDFVVDALR